MSDTHVIVDRFGYVRPSSLDQAIAELKKDEGARVLAGGTNLLVDLKLERTSAGVLIDIGNLPGLEGIEPSSEGVSIGALTTIRTLATSAFLWERYTALAEAAAAFGSTQVSSRGTIGGNVCNGSPASDTVPSLLAFAARARLVGPDGEREVPVEDLLLGPGEVDLREGEILKGIELPPLDRAGSAFLKISRVRADLARPTGAEGRGGADREGVLGGASARGRTLGKRGDIPDRRRPFECRLPEEGDGRPRLRRAFRRVGEDERTPAAAPREADVASLRSLAEAGLARRADDDRDRPER